MKSNQNIIIPASYINFKLWGISTILFIIIEIQISLFGFWGLLFLIIFHYFVWNNVEKECKLELYNDLLIISYPLNFFEPRKILANIDDIKEVQFHRQMNSKPIISWFKVIYKDSSESIILRHSWENNQVKFLEKHLNLRNIGVSFFY